MMGITRRQALLGAAAAATATTTAATRARAQEALVADAEREGSLTFYNGTFGDTIGQEMAGQFQKRYPKLRANVVRSTAQVVYQRLLQDRASGMRNCDVYSSSDISHFDALMKQKRLLDWTPPGAATIYPAFRQLYVEGQYYPALISMMTLAYNTNRVTPAEAPKNWTDLLDPKWKGKAAVGHPGFSGYAGTWAVLMTQLYGDGFIDRLAANNPLVGRSSNDSVTQLNSGERIVAAAPAYVALESAGRGNPIRVTNPTDGALLMVSPIAILADAPHPAAAKLFLDWFLGPENSRILVAQGAEPISTLVPPGPGQTPIDQVKTRRPTVDEIVKGIPVMAERWRDAFGG